MTIKTHIFVVQDAGMRDYLCELVKNEESVYSLSGAAPLPNAQGIYFTRKSILSEFPYGALLIVQTPDIDGSSESWVAAWGAAESKIAKYFSKILKNHKRVGKLDEIGLFREILTYSGALRVTQAQP